MNIDVKIEKPINIIFGSAMIRKTYFLCLFLDCLFSTVSADIRTNPTLDDIAERRLICLPSDTQEKFILQARQNYSAE